MSTERIILGDEFEEQLQSELVQWLVITAHSEDIGSGARAAWSAAGEALETARDPQSRNRMIEEVVPESIVWLFRRPSIVIRNDNFTIPESPTWSELLASNREALLPSLPAIGRVEVDNHPRFHPVGTAFLVADGIVVTNRHIAEHFAKRDGDGYRFALCSRNRRISASVDFKEENTAPVQEDEHQVTDILYMANAGEPDLAFLACPSAAGRPTLSLSDDLIAEEAVAAVGYPLEDGRLRGDLKEAAARIFGNIYEVKRLSPGKVESVDALSVAHDCSTLHGNSGSALLKLSTGEAVGVHHGGGITANYAVAAGEVLRKLDRVTG
ncbi:MAG: serine protease [Erythrobacter sp.]